jgi:hypothetical protein
MEHNTDKLCVENNSLNATVVCLVLVVGILSIHSSPVSAQTSSYTKKTTSGGTLDVLLQSFPEPIKKDVQTNFKLTFDQKGTDIVQPHEDYDVIITKNGNQIFQASALAGHPNQPLHTTEGIATVPFNFHDSGNYTVKISVYGILFIPINPEFAEFPINVAP